MAMEVLSHILIRAKEGFIKDFSIKGRFGGGVEVSHLLFVDNILILCDASKENLEYLSWVLCSLRHY